MAKSKQSPAPISPLDIAREVLGIEIAGLEALREGLDAGFVETLELLKSASGRIIVTGMGKSGHVAHKIASTFSSTGAPALYVHPGEASHGDLGMIARGDVVLALSKSGETAELGDLLAYAHRFSIPVAAITCRPDSTLARAAAAVIALPNANEACGETQAPTTSTTMMMALGDALAVALLRDKGITASEFHGFHPGGNLGAALRRARDMMHGLEATPLCRDSASVGEAVAILNAGGFGCVGLVGEDGTLTGILTDGDLRRQFGKARPDAPVREVMTKSPKTIGPMTLAGDALAILSKGKITALFVVEDRKPVGLLHVHDCLSTGVL
ncbi:MAG: KpsF/GutQ family sugar-phosphate isomerase [Alphaproteobacteria bacterium]|nr:KpsF/GutQ family sugar-phosphate isomerase [Alphaproteobacteria bacterium]